MMAAHLDTASSSSKVHDSAIIAAMPSTCSHGNAIHEDAARQTSTPLPEGRGNSTTVQQLTPELNISSVDTSSSSNSVAMDTDSISIATLSVASDGEREELEPGHISVPIMGYEVMEERSRFSVFKIQVSRGPDDTWFIFRRYSDFDHLNKQLKEIFPHFRLALPPKKWFGDNFDKNFLEDRMIGLQAFLNNLVGNKEVCNSQPVREFFCFDDPPGPHDSLEESRALCESLEERVFSLHQQLADRDRRIVLLEEELRLSQLQVENLRKALKTECVLYTRVLSPRQRLHADHVINLVLLDLMEKASAKRNSFSSLTPMKELVETEEIQAAEIDGYKTSELKASENESSVCLTESLKAAETIRLAPVTELWETESTNGEPEAHNAIPQANDHSGFPENDSCHQDSSTTTSDSAKSRQHTTEGAATVSSQRQGAASNTTDVAAAVRYDAGDMTGPGQLCLSSNELAASSGRISTLSSPQPKHETLLTPGAGGQETISPGAHSVDSSSKKRAKTSAACDGQTSNNDACNNNEAVLI